MGPAGIVVTAYVDGAVVNIVDTAGAYAFLGPTISVTVAAGQHIHVESTAVLGTTAIGGAALNRLSACHQPSAGGALVDNNNDWSPVRLTVNTRIPMMVSQRISGLAAGTYNVGTCYQATAAQAPNWDDNVWSNNRVHVTLN